MSASTVLLSVGLIGLSGAPDWTALSSTYDQFRVHSARATVRLPPAGLVPAMVPVGSALTTYPRGVVMGVDLDAAGGSGPVAYAAALEFAASAEFKADGTMSVVFKVPYMMTQTSLAGGIVQSDWIDCASVTSLMGNMFARADALVACGATVIVSLFQATAELQYDVEFRSRR